MTPDYIAISLRAGDYDRYLLSMLAPPERRQAVQAVLAFHLELAQVPEQASEPMLAQMRYVWWREGVQQLSAGNAPREHPVLQALADFTHAGWVTEQSLGRLIDAHAVLQDAHIPVTLDDMHTLLRPVSYALADVVAEAAGADFMDDAQREAAHAIFTAAAIISILRAVPYHAAHGRCYMPQELLEEHGIAPEQLASEPLPPALPEVIAKVVDQAENLLISAQFMLQELPKLFAAQWRLTRYDARTVQRQKYRLTPAVLRPARWRRILRVWRQG